MALPGLTKLLDVKYNFVVQSQAGVVLLDAVPSSSESSSGFPPGISDVIGSTVSLHAWWSQFASFW